MPAKKPPPSNAPSANGAQQKSAKIIEREQRDAVRAQCVAIERANTSQGNTRVVSSLFDASIALELWLTNNSKAFPSAAVTQKCERLREIASQACDKTIDSDRAYWELAGLYTIIYREANRKELNLISPGFSFPGPPLPALPLDDWLTKEDVEEVLGFALSEIPRKIAEMERAGGA